MLTTGTAPTTNNLQAVTSTNTANQVVAVGANGTVLQCGTACTSSLSNWKYQQITDTQSSVAYHTTLYGVAYQGTGTTWYCYNSSVGGSVKTETSTLATAYATC